ncbi:nicotinamidase/pyrazinamidase [Moraxella lacunata]|uniref:Nicotinamidase/pyrazinamidase n=1 Tax=Moraxella lacunata TaxID=477 RepID=A0A378TRF7_MORLA|nr:isochorismatase family protein [Moraxella lacunata]STZ63376.1 nicotinamidase/pyrazinamidase [Moraxella lacunata]
MKTALLVIDVQNEYFASANGKFDQFNVDTIAQNIANYAKTAEQNGELVIGVQHLMAKDYPLFAEGSHGTELHSSVAGILADKPLVQKRHADSFLNTNLLEILQENGIEQVDICGIMTQNCVTHTALSPFAKDYKILVLSSLCTAPTELIHQIALGALADRAWIEVV